MRSLFCGFLAILLLAVPAQAECLADDCYEGIVLYFIALIVITIALIIGIIVLIVYLIRRSRRRRAEIES